MGQELYHSSPAARAIYDWAEQRRPGLTELCFEGPPEQLNATVNTQPCLFVTDLACALALEEACSHQVNPGLDAPSSLCGPDRLISLTPMAAGNETAVPALAEGAAGFSLGEIAAGCYAGLVGLEQGFDFVCQRAAAMQRCGEERSGVMYAVIGLDAAAVESIAHTTGEVYPVNYNCPGQIVVSCSAEAGPALVEAVAAAHGRALKLPVSGAFHSPLMDPAAEILAPVVDQMTWHEPRIRLYANLTGGLYGDPTVLLSRQVNHPVRWQQTIETMITDGFDRFVEVGPGKALSGFIRKIDPSVTTTGVRDLASLAQTKELLHG